MRVASGRLTFLLLAATLCGARLADAATYTPALTLLNPATDRQFGASVGGVGGDVIVGAPSATTAPGAAYLFDRLSGALLRTLTAPTPAASDGFGHAVGALGANVLVSALHGGPGGATSGAVYLFDAATGAVLRTFADPGANQSFGWALATVGSNVLVGAPGGGRAYLFDGTTGAVLHTFTAVNGGWSVGAVGTDVLVGASSASAYLFDGTTGTLKQTFANPEPGSDDQFGVVLGVGTDRVLVGNPGKLVLTDDDGEVHGGAVYLFDAATGSLLRTFHSAEDDYPFEFGTTLAAVGSDVLIGAPRELNGAGAVYRFDPTSGALLQVIRPGNPTTFTAGKTFGGSVGVAGDRIVVAALTEQRRGTSPGVVYVFDPCGNGVLGAGEHCDDGNLADGDGCSSTCRFECPPAPDGGCLAPSISSLRLSQDHTIFAAHNKLIWKWHGADADATDFGDPLVSAGYALCVYDAHGLVMNVAAPPAQSCDSRPCWTGAGTGFRYDDRQLTPSGVGTVSLARSAGAVRIVIKGEGIDLGIPENGCICPLPISGTITAQLRNTATGTCWGAAYSPPRGYRNGIDKFMGKTP